MSRTHRRLKYFGHHAPGRKFYVRGKGRTCPYGIGCCGDSFGNRHTRNAKKKRRRWLRRTDPMMQIIDETLSDIESLIKMEEI